MNGSRPQFLSLRSRAMPHRCISQINSRAVAPIFRVCAKRIDGLQFCRGRRMLVSLVGLAPPFALALFLFKSGPHPGEKAIRFRVDRARSLDEFHEGMQARFDIAVFLFPVLSTKVQLFAADQARKRLRYAALFHIQVSFIEPFRMASFPSSEPSLDTRQFRIG